MMSGFKRYPWLLHPFGVLQAFISSEFGGLGNMWGAVEAGLVLL